MSPDGGEDPFSNADEGGSARVLGVAHVYLQFVRFRAPFSRSVPVFDSAGAVQCHLSVTFSPCAADGSELTESSIVADGAAQLLDQPLAYRMRLASLNGMDESVAQGSSVFVRYVWLDQTTQSTERIEVISGSATLSHDWYVIFEWVIVLVIGNFVPVGMTFLSIVLSIVSNIFMSLSLSQ